VSLKKEIEPALGVTVKLRAGAPGSLVVLVDGQPVFSKKEARRSPTAQELLELIRGKIPKFKAAGSGA
jgi:selT/selW/selH-like putative selenoprotein